MTRIIKKAPKVSPVEKKKVCRHCGATIGYHENDIKTYSGTDYGGGPDGQTWVDCPSCGKQIILSSW